MKDQAMSSHLKDVPESVEFSPKPRQMFLCRVLEFDAAGRTDAALDLLYDAIDGMMQQDQLSKLDNVIAELEAGEYSLDVLLGVLTATLPVKNRLPSRPAFYQDVKDVVTQRGEYEEGLLSGLG